jgi:hypothetical protein
MLEQNRGLVLMRLLPRVPGVCWLAAVLLLVPAALRAETLVIRNDTGMPVVVQGAYVDRGIVRRDRPTLLAPGGMCNIVLPGNKLITVYDAKGIRTLHQGTIVGNRFDQYYSVKPDNAFPGKVRLEQAAQPFMMKPH